MKKHNWRTLILLVLFLISLIPVYYVIVYNNEKDLEAEEAASSEKVLDVKSEDVTSLQFTLENKEVIFDKTDDSWKLNGDDSFEVDGSVVEDKISQIADMTSERALEDVTNLAEYGLDQPTQVVVLMLQDGTTHTVYFGNTNDSTGNDYIYIDEAKTKVYTVQSSVAQAFEGTLEDYRAEEETSEDAESTEAENADAESADVENTESENADAESADVENTETESADTESKEEDTEDENAKALDTETEEMELDAKAED